MRITFHNHAEKCEQCNKARDITKEKELQMIFGGPKGLSAAVYKEACETGKGILEEFWMTQTNEN